MGDQSGLLAQAAQDVMAHQWSNSRDAMDALMRLVDAAHSAQAVIDAAADAVRERCADIVRNAAAHHGLCCADCEALADLVADDV